MNIRTSLRVESLLFAVAFIAGYGKYVEHPELFAKGRIFSLEEIQVVPKDGLALELQQQIPMETFFRLHAMSEGTISLMDSGDRLTVFHVVATQMVPVDEEKATPRIQQFLINQRSAEAVAKQMEHIMEKANIVYVGDFADEPVAAETKPAAKAESSPSVQPTSSNIEKGARSLQ